MLEEAPLQRLNHPHVCQQDLPNPFAPPRSMQTQGVCTLPRIGTVVTDPRHPGTADTTRVEVISLLICPCAAARTTQPAINTFQMVAASPFLRMDENAGAGSLGEISAVWPPSMPIVLRLTLIFRIFILTCRRICFGKFFFLDVVTHGPNIFSNVPSLSSLSSPSSLMSFGEPSCHHERTFSVELAHETSAGLLPSGAAISSRSWLRRGQ